MTKSLFISIVSIALATGLYAQGYDGSQHIGGPGQNDGLHLLSNDDGSLISCGTFTDTIDADPGPGINLLTHQGEGASYIRKTDAQGNLVWAKQIGGPGFAYVSALVKDPSGNLLLSGSYADSVDFDPGPGIHLLKSYTSSNNDGFILKLDAEGGFIWVADLRGAGSTSCASMAADQNGDIYVGGGFSSYVDFDPGPGSFGMSGEHGGWSGGDAYMLKLDAGGNFVWAKRWGDLRNDFVVSLDLDPDGNVISTGVFMGYVDFDPGPGSFKISAVSYDYFDVFIHKLTPTGDFVWAKAISGTAMEYARDLKVDLNGNIITAGFFAGGADLDPGPVTQLEISHYNDAYLVKLDANGELLWARTITGSADEEIYALDVDELGDIYATGLFELTADFDPGPGEMLLTTNIPNSTSFVFKTDFLGQPLWARQTTGFSTGHNIHVAQNGDVYSTGYFKGVMTVNPGPGETTYQAIGEYDAYIIKQNQDWNFYGTVFNDLNGNGLQDNGENPLAGVPVAASPSGAVVLTNPNGVFHFYQNLLGDTVAAVAPWPGWQFNPAFVLPDSSQTAMNFAAQGVQPVDAVITAVETIRFRPGFTTLVNIQVTNLGAQTIAALPVRLTITRQTLPGPLEFVSSTLPPVSQTQDVINWEVPNIGPGESKTFAVIFKTPVNVGIGAKLAMNAEALLFNDASPLNNKAVIETEVFGSLDPNEKEVFPQAVALQAMDTTNLRYVIRFQNTGSYPADFVVIRDTLPEELDLSTLRVIASSHPNTHRLFGPHVLEFRFDPIHLPDSTSNEPASHGYVAFTVRAKAGLSLGTVIHNRAGIYFDYNEPVITNTADLHVGTSVKTTEPAAQESIDFDLSPNPVAAFSNMTLRLNTRLATGATVTVLDASGKTVQQIKLAAREQQFVLSGLPAGAYFVQVRAGNLVGGKALVVKQ